MVNKSDTTFNDFDELKLPRINVSDDFSSKVMSRVTLEETGGLSAMSSGMRVFVVSLVFLIYSSTGILIGVQRWKSSAQGYSSQNENELFIKDFIQTYHLNSIGEIEKIFRPVE